MSKLLDAIDAEVRGDYAAAIEAYRQISDEGSPLDRIGIAQAIARCFEKSGALAQAAPWRQKAAQGYMALSDGDMPKDERRYYALVEVRNAVQDLAGSSDLKGVGAEYAHILAENWKGGPEGLTHEGLFGALFFRSQGDWLNAAKYAFDVAEAVNEQAVETGDPATKALSLATYELAEDLATRAGRMDVAKVAALRATALRGGPKPVKLGGL